MRKLKIAASLCECCGANYSSKKEGSRFCSDSCRINNHQKEKRKGLIKRPTGFSCPTCNVQDLYTPAGEKHRLIRCGTCHSEWQLNVAVLQ